MLKEVVNDEELINEDVSLIIVTSEKRIIILISNLARKIVREINSFLKKIRWEN